MNDSAASPTAWYCSEVTVCSGRLVAARTRATARSSSLAASSAGVSIGSAPDRPGAGLLRSRRTRPRRRRPAAARSGDRAVAGRSRFCSVVSTCPRLPVDPLPSRFRRLNYGSQLSAESRGNRSEIGMHRRPAAPVTLARRRSLDRTVHLLDDQLCRRCATEARGK